MAINWIAARDFSRNRIGWHSFSIVLSLCVMTAAAFVLRNMLRDIDVDKVVGAVSAIPAPSIVGAVVLAAASFATLTFYDFFALRTIGRLDVPYRLAALTSFFSYTFGHSLGAMAITSAIIRYRMYSPYGFTAPEIAKVAFITGLTYWLGNAVVLGFGIAYAPAAASALNGLPQWLNQAGALGVLVAVVGYLIWLSRRPRHIGRGAWRIPLPGLRLTVFQIGIGILDLSLAASAMYVLLPAHPSVDFISAVVVFVTATLLGFIAHAPSGLGVFDAAMLVGLSQIEPEPLIASLLLFRGLYYVLPFLIALAVFIGRELMIRQIVRIRYGNGSAGLAACAKAPPSARSRLTKDSDPRCPSG